MYSSGAVKMAKQYNMKRDMTKVLRAASDTEHSQSALQIQTYSWHCVM